MSGADPNIGGNGEGTTAAAGPMMNNDIPAMKEVAKEVMQSISSEVNGKSSDITNGEMTNGGLESSENGNKGAGGESSSEEQDGA